MLLKLPIMLLSMQCSKIKPIMLDNLIMLGGNVKFKRFKLGFLLIFALMIT